MPLPLEAPELLEASTQPQAGRAGFSKMQDNTGMTSGSLPPLLPLKVINSTSHFLIILPV